MTPPEIWTTVDQYIGNLLLKPDPALTGALESSAAANLPPISVAPNQGKFLHLLARLMGAQKILEIGTLGAYSTIWLARALPPTGKLITLEADPKHAQVATQNITRAGLQNLVDLRLGKALDTLPSLQSEAPFDLIFIDADKPTTPDYLTYALKLSRPGTLIIVDNVVRNGKVTDESSSDPNVQGVQRTLKLISSNPRLDATVLQLVGQKGYDGMALARVIS